MISHYICMCGYGGMCDCVIVWQAAKRVPTVARSVWDVYASFFNVQTGECVCVESVSTLVLLNARR